MTTMVKQNSVLVDEIYLITQYRFHNESLLREVFTPPYLYIRNTTHTCFERLEFLGDSVLNLVISLILFDLYPLENEGDLTLRKNDLVSGRRLSEISQSMRFMKLMPEIPGKVWRRDSDTMEALIGAIYLDGGYEKAKKFIYRHWSKPARALRIAPIDPKSKLFMWAQKQHLPVPLYKIINRTSLDVNYTMTLQLKDTHGLGIVKVTTDIKKRGELQAAKAMLGRIENREKWKTLLNSESNYITVEDLNSTTEDIKQRLYLWCIAHNNPLPQYKTVEGKGGDGERQFTTLVYFSDYRGAYGVSNSVPVSEKKAALKMLLRLCDEEREKAMFGGHTKNSEIDVCIPRNFKSLVDEWVTKNHLGKIYYSSEEIVSRGTKLYNISLTIPKSNLGTVHSRSYKKKIAEHKAAARMIERIFIVYNKTETHLNTTEEEIDDSDNFKVKLHTWTSMRKLPKPIYKTETVTGLKHSLLFTVSVSVTGQNKTLASAYSKRIAQQKAASTMLKQIQTYESLHGAIS